MALLAACGGGGGASTSGTASSGGAVQPANPAQDPNAPALTGNIATDGFTWFNYRRKQAGLPQLTRNSLIDQAAQSHSDYQNKNNTVTHTETPGSPGFTGADLLTRLSAAGYVFNLAAARADGEVIAGAHDSSGFSLAESLITAIYHRFVIFEPAFKEGGSGAAVSSAGYTYFTTDYAANNGFGSGLGQGNFITYPFSNQTQVQTSFSSDLEAPDPVPNQDVVGYPISVHTGVASRLTVQAFSLRPRGGANMNVLLLVHASDAETPQSAAAIIPLTVLGANTTYDVSFSGLIDGVAVARDWSFTTQ